MGIRNFRNGSVIVMIDLLDSYLVLVTYARITASDKSPTILNTTITNDGKGGRFMNDMALRHRERRI